MSYLTGKVNGVVYTGAVKWHKNDENVMLFNSKSTRDTFMTTTLHKQQGNITAFNPFQSIELYGMVKNFEKTNYTYIVMDSDFSDTPYCCYVTDIEITSRGTTKLYLELDVFQQYVYDCTFYRSYIERAHVKTSDDIIGAYTQIEPISGTQYIKQELLDFTADLSPYYVLHCLGQIGISEELGNVVFPYNKNCGGIPSNLCLGSDNLNDIQKAINKYSELKTNVLFFNIPQDGRQNCQYIQTVPSFTAGGNYTDPSSQSTNNLNFHYPNSVTKEYSFNYNTLTMINGYRPKNKKLFTSQCQTLSFSNRNGTEKTFLPELLTKFNNISFNLRGSCGGVGKYLAILNNYNAPDNERFLHVNYGGYVSLGYDMNNSSAVDFQRSMNLLNTAGDVGFTIFSRGLTPTSGKYVYKGATFQNEKELTQALKNQANANTIDYISSAGGIVSQITNGINDSIATYQSNIKNIGSSSGLDDFGLFTYSAKLYVKSIDRDTAESLDNFLSIYGYSINEILSVSEYMNTRSNYNYIKVSNLNANLWCPDNHYTLFKSLFENGIRIWHNYNNFGNLGVNNV